MRGDAPIPSDAELQDQIDALEAEREKLRAREGEDDPNLEADAARGREIGVELDRLWDLKRQRTALREAGGDPDDADERDAGTVENYEQ